MLVAIHMFRLLCSPLGFDRHQMISNLYRKFRPLTMSPLSWWVSSFDCWETNTASDRKLVSKILGKTKFLSRSTGVFLSSVVFWQFYRFFGFFEHFFSLYMERMCSWLCIYVFSSFWCLDLLSLELPLCIIFWTCVNTWWVIITNSKRRFKSPSWLDKPITRTTEQSNRYTRKTQTFSVKITVELQILTWWRALQKS